MYSAGAKQPNDPDKAWLILLGSLLFVVLIVCPFGTRASWTVRGFPQARRKLRCSSAPAARSDDRRADYSNYGDSVWIWAPGGNAPTAGWPCGALQFSTLWTMPDAVCRPNVLVANRGTSFAAPFVAGNPSDHQRDIRRAAQQWLVPGITVR
jgi:Subtilase family